MDLEKGEMLPDGKCIVCGEELYITDHGNHEVTYHCSSGAARFWDYDRGTIEQVKSKDHWDRSRLEIYLAEK
jgi:hypothetical protein